MAQRDSNKLYPCEHFESNQALIASLLEYTRPPHEPVPNLEGISEAGQALLASEEGVQLVSRWARAFNRTLTLLTEYESSGATNDVGEIVRAQRASLGRLTARFDRRTGSV